MNKCPKCGAGDIITGRFVEWGTTQPMSVYFRPKDARWHEFYIRGGFPLDVGSFACPACGLVWTMVEKPQELRERAQRLAKPAAAH